MERFVQLAVAGVGTALASVFAVLAWPPRADRGGAGWRRAARLDELTPGEPRRVVLSRPREDGWYRARIPTVVYLVSDGRGGARALSAVCTHLGCGVRWDAAARRFRCPCHGGAYDEHGAVVSGPPPRPLAPLDVEVKGPDGQVWVRL